MSLFFLLPTAPSDPVTYNLSGTSGSPVTRTYIETQPETANLIWSISGDTGANNTQKGYVQWDGYGSEAITYANQEAWRTPQDGWTTLYVRLTADSGTADASSHAIDGSTWHTLTEDTTNIWWRESNASATPESCVVKVEIATDSGGTDIVATGYYKATVYSDV